MFPIKTLIDAAKFTATVVGVAVPVAYGAYKIMEGTETGLRRLGRVIFNGKKLEVEVRQAA